MSGQYIYTTSGNTTFTSGGITIASGHVYDPQMTYVSSGALPASQPRTHLDWLDDEIERTCALARLP